MNRPEIIELANQLTERKGEKVLNLQSLYRFVLQDICKRNRFWWRRVVIHFPLVPGTTTYDLTATNIGITPAITEILFDEITKITVILTANPLKKAELVPIFDPEAVIEMQNNTLNAAPSRYTMNPGDYKTLFIDPPDFAYTTYVTGWAMPNPASDSTSDVVPLIPAWGHNTIVEGLQRYIFRYVYGDGHAKTIAAKNDYEQALTDLLMRKQFDPNYRSQLSLSEDAVRST